MWSQVQKDLENALTAKIYPTLLSDVNYRNFLTFAGLGPNFPKDNQIPPALRSNVETNAKIQAFIIVNEVRKQEALNEKTCGQKTIVGPGEFYRFWSSRDQHRRIGTWWFEENVMRMCTAQAGKLAADRRQWLREHLAVSLDWSTMDRIDVMSLRAHDEAPTIVGLGAKQRMYSSSAIPQGKASSQQYWPNYAKYFPGGVRQTVYPFVPLAHKGKDLNQFLTQY
jgi:hypothetical protein